MGNPETGYVYSAEFAAGYDYLNKINNAVGGVLWNDKAAVDAYTAWSVKLTLPNSPDAAKIKDKPEILKKKLLLEVNKVIKAVKDPQKKDEAEDLASAWDGAKVVSGVGKAPKKFTDAMQEFSDLRSKLEDDALGGFVSHYVTDYLLNGEKKYGTFGSPMNQVEILKKKASLVKGDDSKVVAEVAAWLAKKK